MRDLPHRSARLARARVSTRLRARTPQAIIDSLLTGAMRPQGARLSGAERRAVAEFITGKSIEGDVSGAQTGRCTAPRVAAGFREGAAMDRMEPVDDEHALSAGRAGWPLAVRSAAIEVEVGVRFP